MPVEEDELVGDHRAGHIDHGAEGLVPAFLHLGPDAAFLSAALVGLTVGAEVDVIVFLATRHFGLKAFGALYGGLLVALSLGTALGPLAAASVYDRTGRYDAFFWAAIGCMVVSVLALASLPQPAFGGERDAEGRG